MAIVLLPALRDIPPPSERVFVPGGIDMAVDVISLRRVLACAGGVSVRAQFKPPSFESPPFSLRALAELLLRRTVDVNIILVGVELFLLDMWAMEKLDAAIAMTREAFAQKAVDIRLGAITWSGIPLGASAFEHIDGEEEATLLRQTFASPGGDAIDVFFVRSMFGTTVGLTNKFTSCSPDNHFACLVSIEPPADVTARTLAHELTHYLGVAEHSPNADNLMFWNVSDNTTRLTASQGDMMRDHCILYWRCRW